MASKQTKKKKKKKKKKKETSNFWRYKIFIMFSTISADEYEYSSKKRQIYDVG